MICAAKILQIANDDLFFLFLQGNNSAKNSNGPKSECHSIVDRTLGRLHLGPRAGAVPEPAVAEQSRSIEGPTPALQAIDSLMWQQPDSALLALMAYEGDASEYNHHYAQLLTSELLYKNDYEQTNRRELQQAVVYFDSLLCQFPPLQRGLGGFKTRPDQTNQIAFLSARAHYINGVGYYERDSVIEACREYLKALEVMEGCFEEKEIVREKTKFMALTFSHLTNLFSDFYLHEQSIYFAQGSLPYYEKQESPSWHLSWVLNQIGSHYEMMNELDSADCFYKRAVSTLHDINSLMYRDIASHQAFLEYKKDSRKVDEAIQQLEEILLKSENDTELVARHAAIGEIYYHEKHFDSAWHHLNMVFHETSDIGFKKQTAEWLVEICKAQGRVSEMLEYAEFLVPFANMEENNSERKSQLIELYNAFRQRKLERQHQDEIKKHAKQAIVVFGGMFVAMLAVVFFYRKNKRSKQKLETQMEAERHAHKMQQAALTGKLRKSNETLRELKGQLQQQGNDAVSKPEQANSFANEPICQLIMERVNEGQFKSQMDCTVYKDYALGKEQLMALREAADRHFNRFTSRLAQTYPSLTKGDLDYCCLYLLGLTDADISALMQRAYNTVSERSRKLKTIFDSEVALPITIRSLANGFASV